MYSKDELITLRRDIHSHPEPAFQENRTADIVARELKRFGIAVHMGVGKTGVVGILKAGSSSRSIGLRAEMDALRLAEHNDFVYKSVYADYMHACGHDGHTVMLLGAACCLAARPDFDGTVVFIFQPAEEGEGGALEMIRDGLFKRFPMDSVYGLHNWPGLEAGKIAAFAGPVMAGANRFEITLRGRGSHAAMPHLANDVVVAASQLVMSLQTVTSRSLHPTEAAVVSVTRFDAGNAWNVLPEQAALHGTIRIFSQETQNEIETAITRLADGTAAAYGAKAETKFIYIDPPIINTASEAERCFNAACDLLGKNMVTNVNRPSMASEDFSCLLEQRPGCYVWLGNGAETGGRVLHSPLYDFNDEILPVGIAYWTRLAQTLLS
jgi:hippurate hydrolase